MTTRKRLLFGGLTFLLALAGAGLYLSAHLSPDVAHAEPLPQAEFTDRAGRPVSLQAFAGKVVVLDFWAST